MKQECEVLLDEIFLTCLSEGCFAVQVSFSYLPLPALGPGAHQERVGFFNQLNVANDFPTESTLIWLWTIYFSHFFILSNIDDLFKLFISQCLLTQIRFLVLTSETIIKCINIRYTTILLRQTYID